MAREVPKYAVDDRVELTKDLNRPSGLLEKGLRGKILKVNPSDEPGTYTVDFDGLTRSVRVYEEWIKKI